jgi:diguanylate cyclase (GGDEF)-like protein
MKNMQKSDERPMILIVDDTPTNIQVLAEALCSDYRVKVATSGKAALALSNNPESRPDLILLDVMMPEMDGYEVCRRLKQSPATQGIPVIFVTAKNDVTDEEHGLRLGAMDYIVKPFRLAIVKARVQNHINLKIKTDLLETLALIDGLTGIPNRRRFDEVLDIEWKRAQRGGSVLAVIMADIDYFKAYNDNYGHSAGDQCLTAVAKTLASSLYRPSDMMARYGGEEFVGILPDIDVEGARVLAERWRANVAALALPHQHSKAENYVTISVGYASLRPTQYQSPMELVEKADKMLYQAKELGRNRVCGALM